MRLLCYLKETKDASRPILLFESNDIEELKIKAVEYAKSNPSFKADWVPGNDESRQELRIDFDYRLEIQE